ncbi:unnamed protein product [Fusarium venenatum]|uniref:Uncharacterized protein n=1 Tax=Fusarium venenatum TaxID=56646 RepID=A0A2L2TUA3_9HYPO|nr:uncharacterized protein FVRRES_04228 [Fusarium venenatum]CEI67716.1 unnamed protein product [Fusarium venenatum]
MSPPKQEASLTRYSLGSEMIKEALRIWKDGEQEDAVNSKDWILRRGLGSKTVGQWEKSRATEVVSTEP